ncbi:hypothetical protein NJC38_00895 [Pseudomonas sp. 21LCFQ010]|uniref:hypothetical protein n=1 Tax=Pseudomonas sp. 21LCFQ010 TaxID=2957506 RepID=UPI00209687EC|nr:hypothetical protein [Pseudomonas sp. 21LCFQ010]MCO8160720.1 hypothetical protein [Pseudomonas sp. 21LCFQ010]
MKLIKPVDITEPKLVSSNVSENDYPAWSSATRYAIGARVISNHRIYEALVENSNRDPATDTLQPPAWLDTGATNRWRMFDDKLESLTTNPGTITVTIKPGAVVNSIAMFNVSGKSVLLQMVDAGEGVVYSKTVTLVDAGVTNWYDHFFLPVELRTDLVLLDLPAYGSANIVVTVDAGAEQAAVGHFVVGAQQELGTALYGTSVGINDYSIKKVDDFGNTTVVRRSYSNRADFDIVLDTPTVGRVRRLLAEMRATPVVWIGEESYEATILFGYYKDFTLVFSGPSVSEGSISVEAIV